MGNISKIFFDRAATLIVYFHHTGYTYVSLVLGLPPSPEFPAAYTITTPFSAANFTMGPTADTIGYLTQKLTY